MDIRTITDDELVAYSRAAATGFGFQMSDEAIELRRRTLDLDRTHAAFADDGTVIGTARSFPTGLSLPGGGSVRAGAVTNVTVLPTHRRRGVLTGMMRAQLDDIASRGEPVAILIASESVIYGRFGYGAATWTATLEVERPYARFARPPDAGLRMVDRTEMRSVVPARYERFQAGQPGAIGRDEWFWDLWYGVVDTGRNKDAFRAFHVLHDDGWLTYTIDDRWEHRHPRSTLNVVELVALTPDAYAALWHHCLRHDLVEKVVAGERPPLEPLPWLLTDPRRAARTDPGDFLWVRLLDVPAALAARRYGAADTLVLEVVDGFRAWTARYRLDGGSPACALTEDEPDLTVAVADLGASYLGGTPLWPAAAAGRVVEHTAGAIERFDRLFLTAAPPWCHTWF
jgi:predicted acetyltransferase